MLPAEFTTGTIEGTFDSEDPLGCGVAVPFERSRVMQPLVFLVALMDERGAMVDLQGDSADSIDASIGVERCWWA